MYLRAISNNFHSAINRNPMVSRPIQFELGTRTMRSDATYRSRIKSLLLSGTEKTISCKTGGMFIKLIYEKTLSGLICVMKKKEHDASFGQILNSRGLIVFFSKRRHRRDTTNRKRYEVELSEQYENLFYAKYQRTRSIYSRSLPNAD